MKIDIEISDKEIEQMVANAVQAKVNEWFKEELDRHSTFRRFFEKQYKETVKEMIYDPELKQQIIDKAVKEAAYELRRKGMNKLLEEVKS